MTDIKLIYFAAAIPAVYLITTLLVPLNIKLAKLLNMIDISTENSTHKVNTPLIGGLSISVAIILALVFLRKFVIIPESPGTLSLAVGSLLITGAGLIDDKLRLRASNKLFFQIAVAVFMFWRGYRITLLTNPWDDAITLQYFSFPVTIFWFLILMNSFNLIDGIDGLASGIAMIVSFILVIVGFRFNNIFLMITAALLLAGTTAFLRFNFPPAKIFLGDTGSQFIGFYLAAISIAGSAQYKGITAMTLLIPIIVMFIPLIDTTLAILRRIKYKKSIFDRDQQHLHHKMLKMGLGAKTINYTCYFITLLFGLIAVGFSYAEKRILFTILICLAVCLFLILYSISKKRLLKGNSK